MKRKKTILLLLIFGAVTILLSSCTDSDGKSDNYIVDIATVVPNAAGNGYSLRLDDGTTLLPSNDNLSEIKSSRAIVQYTILDGASPGYTHLVDVYQFNYILTKGVINLTTANADSIGNDKANILDLWVGDDYLNFNFSYFAGGYSIHAINLVNNTTIVPPADGKIHLEFRHNAEGDFPNFLAEGLVAFDLRPYQVQGQDSVRFVIDANEFTGEKSYEITYKYSAPTAKHKIPALSSIKLQYR